MKQLIKDNFGRMLQLGGIGFIAWGMIWWVTQMETLTVYVSDENPFLELNMSESNYPIDSPVVIPVINDSSTFINERIISEHVDSLGPRNAITLSSPITPISPETPSYLVEIGAYLTDHDVAEQRNLVFLVGSEADRKLLQRIQRQRNEHLSRIKSHHDNLLYYAQQFVRLKQLLKEASVKDSLSSTDVADLFEETSAIAGRVRDARIQQGSSVNDESFGTQAVPKTVLSPEHKSVQPSKSQREQFLDSTISAETQKKDKATDKPLIIIILGAISTVSGLVLAWRLDKRNIREWTLKCEKLELEVEKLKAPSDNEE